MSEIDQGIYAKALKKWVNLGIIDLQDSILVTCGGQYDASVFSQVGFKEVTISNLDDRMVGTEYDNFGYAWSRQNCEEMTYSAGTFDWVIVHSGLHHCYSPHRAFTEMLRVCRKGAIAFESSDNALMRLGKRFGLAGDYEIEAVIGNGLTHGGVQNSEIPNFIYRWTEQEVAKTTNSFWPESQNEFWFYYNLQLPTERLSMHKNPIKRLLSTFVALFLRIFTWIFPKQANEFAFLVRRQQPQRWIRHTEDGWSLDTAYVK